MSSGGEEVKRERERESTVWEISNLNVSRMLTWRIAKGKLGIKSPISKRAKKTQYFSLGES